MTENKFEALLEALLDSWDRSNRIHINFLHALPEGALELKVTDSSPSIAAMFLHIHYVRLLFVQEDAPEFASDLPTGEWRTERDPARLTQMLNESALVVREAVTGRLQAGLQMEVRYDHPILMLQHLIWHDGYHHGQMKLALKVAGLPMDDEEIGPVTWNVWMLKN